MAGKFLDYTGLSYFWDKLKTWISDHFLSLSGGTVDGNVTVKGTLATRASNIDRDIAAPSGIQYGTSVQWLDKDDERIGVVRVDKDTDGYMYLKFGVFSEDTSSNEQNSWLIMGVDRSGSRKYTVSDPAAFRSAIGIGTVSIGSEVQIAQSSDTGGKRYRIDLTNAGNLRVDESSDSGSSWTTRGYASLHSSASTDIGTTKTTDISTAVSVATSTHKSIGSVSLEAGKWIITYGGQFASNATGVRAVYLNTTQNAAGSSSWYRCSLEQVPACSGQNTYLRGSYVYTVSSTTTLYLNLWQNSGSSLNCYGNITAIKVG